MSEQPDTLQVRSFRVVFALERRLHKIDRWRIPVPYGVPLRGIGYALGALIAVLCLGRLPLLGGLFALIPPPLRLVILPVGIAYALTRLRIDGRPAHVSLVALGRLRLSPGVVSGFRAAPAPGCEVALGDVVLVPDERWTRFRPALVEGPARVLVRFPAHARAHARALELRQASGRPMLQGKEVVLRAGQRLRLR